MVACGVIRRSVPASTSAASRAIGAPKTVNGIPAAWNASETLGVTVPKAVCVRLGDRGELSACFNPQTLRYEALWTGGFVRFDPKRHGLLDGLILDGTPLPRPEGKKPDRPFVYHGFYRHGKRIVFSYRIGDIEMLDAPWVEGGRFTRVVAPAAGQSP